MKKNIEKMLAEIIFWAFAIMTLVSPFALLFSIGAMIEMWKITIIPFAISVFCLVWLAIVVVVAEKAKG